MYEDARVDEWLKTNRDRLLTTSLATSMSWQASFYMGRLFIAWPTLARNACSRQLQLRQPGGQPAPYLVCGQSSERGDKVAEAYGKRTCTPLFRINNPKTSCEPVYLVT